MPRKKSTTEEAQIRPNAVDRNASCRSRQNIIRSPIHLLFPDILIEIFSKALLADEEQFTSQNWDKTAPMNVAAVCQRWRSIALSSPSLWSIFGSSTYMGWRGFRFPWKYLNTFVLRSQQSPLDLNISVDFPTLADNEKLSTLMIDLQSRFRKINISWGRLTVMEFCLPVLSNLPVLEAIRLRLSPAHGRRSLHLHLADAPRLRYLDLTGPVTLHLDRDLVFNSLASVTLSLRRLYTFDARNGVGRSLTAHDCPMIMRASPFLKIFSIRDFSDDEIYLDSATLNYESSATWHPNLSVLRLLSIHHNAARYILENLRLPGLRELELAVTYQSDPMTCGLRPHLLKSNPALEILHVSNCESAEIMQCLELVPSLRDLTICKGGSSLPYFRDLSIRLTITPNAQICPKLRSFTKMGKSNSSEYAREITSMICSRCDCSFVGLERCLKSAVFPDRKAKWDLRYVEELLRCAERDSMYI